MTEILGAFRKRAEDLYETINSAGGLRTTVEGLRRQMAETDRRRQMSRARAELKRLDAQIKEMVTAVGVQSVGLYRAGRLTTPELGPLCEHIVELETAVEQQRLELSQLEAVHVQEAPSDERRCLQCGHALPADATFCPYCGTAAPAETSQVRYCADCGGELRANSRFCPHCGEAVAGR